MGESYLNQCMDQCWDNLLMFRWNHQRFWLGLGCRLGEEFRLPGCHKANGHNQKESKLGGMRHCVQMENTCSAMSYLGTSDGEISCSGSTC